MVNRKFTVEDFLEVLGNVAKSQMQPLQRLELRSYPGRKGSDGHVSNIAKEMLHTDFLRFFGLDYGWGMDEGSRGRSAILSIRS